MRKVPVVRTITRSLPSRPVVSPPETGKNLAETIYDHAVAGAALVEEPIGAQAAAGEVIGVVAIAAVDSIVAAAACDDVVAAAAVEDVVLLIAVDRLCTV